jgi:hypothetical protein
MPLGKQWPFSKLDNPVFFEGARQVPLANEDFKLAQHPDAWIEAKTFIKLIRKALYGLYKREQTTYDSDIEQGVNFGWVPMAQYHALVPHVFSEYCLVLESWHWRY